MIKGFALVLTLEVVLSGVALFSLVWGEWLALILMVLAGIPHGSFDLRLARLRWRSGITSKKVVGILYALAVVGMSSLCIFKPVIGFVLFLCISLIHFCEGEANSEPTGSRLRGVIFGIGAVLLPIGLHFSESAEYMRFFLSYDILLRLKVPLEKLAFAWLLVIVCCLVWDILFLSRSERPAKFERLICLVSWVSLAPLAGFAVWFIGRHSWQHYQHSRAILSDDESYMPLDFTVISLAALAGLLPLSLVFDLSNLHDFFNAVIILIAGLTLPHIIVTFGLVPTIKPAH